MIVGGGRVGNALAQMGTNDLVVKRGEPIPADGEGPIFVCTRNDSLAGIVEACPENRREDLVFLQNGMLQPWLDTQGLGDNTQVGECVHQSILYAIYMHRHAQSASYLPVRNREAGARAEVFCVQVRILLFAFSQAFHKYWEDSCSRVVVLGPALN